MPEVIVNLSHANIYQGDNLILQDVNTAVNKGEFVYLVGKTGTGKSSLLKTLYGDIPLREGEGEVVGYNLRNMDWKKVPYMRRNLGVVFQDFQLLTDRNVNDNLKFVLKATGWKDEKLMNEKINDVLDKVGLRSKGFKMPFEMSGGEQQRVDIARALLNSPKLILADELKINDVLDKVGLRSKGFKMPFEMSGGEQQRVDIARALLNSPKLILADEPTGNLDPETSDEIMQLLFQIGKDYGTSIIMATHDYMVINKFQARMLRTERGRVIDNATISI